jgi:hypothetical protein
MPLEDNDNKFSVRFIGNRYLALGNCLENYFSQEKLSILLADFTKVCLLLMLWFQNLKRHLLSFGNSHFQLINDSTFYTPKPAIVALLWQTLLCLQIWYILFFNRIPKVLFFLNFINNNTSLPSIFLAALFFHVLYKTYLLKLIINL